MLGPVLGISLLSHLIFTPQVLLSHCTGAETESREAYVDCPRPQGTSQYKGARTHTHVGFTL